MQTPRRRRALSATTLMSLGAFFLACGADGELDTKTTTAHQLSDREIEVLVPKIEPIDFFLDDVCVGDDDRAILGMSPTDAACKKRRDLEPGERVPYHKVEYPGKAFIDENGSDVSAAGWLRVTRANNLPVRTTRGIAGVTIADNTDEAGRFWTPPNSRDTIHGPDVVSDRTVWRAFAIDHSGPYRNVSTHCTGATTDPDAPKDGNPQAILENGKFSGRAGTFDKQPTKYINTRGRCPDMGGRSGGKVRWSFSEERYSTGFGYPQDVTPPLLTLFVTNDVDVDGAHVETTFNTRELGQTSHQSWDNLAHEDAKGHEDELRDKEVKLRRDHKCDRPHPRPPFRLDGWKQRKDGNGEPMNVWTAPDGKNEWALVSCRITATVVPPHDRQAGDDPAVWVDALHRYELSAPLMGAPLPPQPKVASISPKEARKGEDVAIVGNGFAESGNTVMFGERGCSVNNAASVASGRGRERSITVAVPECARGKNDAGVRVQVFDGRATSDDDVTFTMRR